MITSVQEMRLQYIVSELKRLTKSIHPIGDRDAELKVILLNAAKEIENTGLVPEINPLQSAIFNDLISSSRNIEISALKTLFAEMTEPTEILIEETERLFEIPNDESLNEEEKQAELESLKDSILACIAALKETTKGDNWYFFKKDIERALKSLE